MVVGLEPTLLAEQDFECSASPNSATPAQPQPQPSRIQQSSWGNRTALPCKRLFDLRAATGVDGPAADVPNGSFESGSESLKVRFEANAPALLRLRGHSKKSYSQFEYGSLRA